ncbi:MAG: bifunctional adenosylcobinamide kinase/adenosylcobinamide-phosphate guanylyltransferase [Thermodesulfovibrionales bacterium]|jgi:adenosylcobinamide kinase/adenosylcobinamide-phosphate guanylyltransferase
MKKITFITGGAKSGKSSFALKQASSIAGKKAYIATAEALDEEMRKRIEDHRKQRGKEWDTFEEPLMIAEVIKKIGGQYDTLVLDCLTLWLSNVMHANLNTEAEIERLISSLLSHQTSVFIVSNEVGMGIVPENEMARKFRDMTGMLNQKLAGAADEVYIVVAGIPLRIKGTYDTGNN